MGTANAAHTAKLRLITIGPSHYCEKARWALERVGASYSEDAHIPLLHYTATARFRQRSVPILVLPHGVLGDSTAILRHLDTWVDEPKRLFPADPGVARDVDALEERFDRDLGPATRRWVYAWLIDDAELFVDVMKPKLSAFESLALRAAAPVFRRGLRRGLRLSPRARTRSLERIRAVFTEVDALLEDGRKHLAGDRFTAADLTFAALAAPALAPAGYGAWLPPDDRLPDGMRREVDALRATRAGQHALRMYDEERKRRVA